MRLEAIPTVTDRLLELPHPPFGYHGIVSPVYFADLPEFSARMAGDTHGKIAGEWDLEVFMRGVS